MVWLALLAIVLLWALARIAGFVSGELSWSDLGHGLLLGVFTLIRAVLVLIALASLFWVPIGVWLGLRPVWARRAQPLAQFLAAFPANLLFPPVVLFIVYFRLSPDIWLTPLMILGTRVVNILFNVVAVAPRHFPGDLREGGQCNFRSVGGWLWWSKVMIPGIFHYVTGAYHRFRAVHGNAAIVAEVASWVGDTRLTAHGLGAYIAAATDKGVHGPRGAWRGCDVRLRAAVQPPAVATAVYLFRTTPEAGLRRTRVDTSIGPTSLLEVRGCRQAYHKEASADLVVLDDVNLTLREGEMVALLGRSGLRQIDAAAYRRRPADADGRQGAVARSAGARARRGRRNGVPEFRVISLADRAGERGTRPRGARCASP